MNLPWKSKISMSASSTTVSSMVNCFVDSSSCKNDQQSPAMKSVLTTINGVVKITMIIMMTKYNMILMIYITMMMRLTLTIL